MLAVYEFISLVKAERSEGHPEHNHGQHPQKHRPWLICLKTMRMFTAACQKHIKALQENAWNVAIIREKSLFISLSGGLKGVCKAQGIPANLPGIFIPIFLHWGSTNTRSWHRQIIVDNNVLLMAIEPSSRPNTRVSRRGQPRSAIFSSMLFGATMPSSCGENFGFHQSPISLGSAINQECCLHC